MIVEEIARRIGEWIGGLPSWLSPIVLGIIIILSILFLPGSIFGESPVLSGISWIVKKCSSGKKPAGAKHDKK